MAGGDKGKNGVNQTGAKQGPGVIRNECHDIRRYYIWCAARFAVTRARNVRKGTLTSYLVGLINYKDILCHDIKVQRRSGGTAPFILILDTGCSRVGSSIPLPFYSQKQNLRYPLNEELGGAHLRICCNFGGSATA
jgi:hypothetical protein